MLSNNKQNFLLYQINSKNHKNRNVYVRTAKHKLRLFANNMRVIKKFKIKNNPKRDKRELNFCCCNLDIDIHYFYTFLIRIIHESLLFKKRASRNICVKYKPHVCMCVQKIDKPTYFVNDRLFYCTLDTIRASDRSWPTIILCQLLQEPHTEGYIFCKREYIIE